MWMERFGKYKHDGLPLHIHHQMPHFFYFLSFSLYSESVMNNYSRQGPIVCPSNNPEFSTAPYSKTGNSENQFQSFWKFTFCPRGLFFHGRSIVGELRWLLRVICGIAETLSTIRKCGLCLTLTSHKTTTLFSLGLDDITLGTMHFNGIGPILPRLLHICSPPSDIMWAAHE